MRKVTVRRPRTSDDLPEIGPQDVANVLLAVEHVIIIVRPFAAIGVSDLCRLAKTLERISERPPRGGLSVCADGKPMQWADVHFQTIAEIMRNATTVVCF